MSAVLEIVPARTALPALVAAAGGKARERFLEFFAARIRNRHTRRAYGQATGEVLAWCERAGVASIAEVKPLHVAAYVEQLGRERLAPTVKQRLAAIRHLFDWFVTGQVVPANPAASVRGPAHRVKRGKTPVLDPSEARALLDAIDATTPAGLRDRALIAAIDATTPVGLRDRALIGLMVYSFARIGAALAMRVEDVYVQNRPPSARPLKHNSEKFRFLDRFTRAMFAPRGGTHTPCPLTAPPVPRSRKRSHDDPHQAEALVPGRCREERHTYLRKGAGGGHGGQATCHQSVVRLRTGS